MLLLHGHKTKNINILQLPYPQNLGNQVETKYIYLLSLIHTSRRTNVYNHKKTIIFRSNRNYEVIINYNLYSYFHKVVLSSSGNFFFHLHL